MKQSIVSMLLAVSCAGVVSGHELPEGQEHKAQAVSQQAVQTGSGDFTFIAEPTWGKLADGGVLGPTHGSIVVDSKNRIYMSTDGPASLYVFEQSGRLLDTIAPEARGMHQMLVREENGEEFIYGAQLNAYGGKRVERIVKLNLQGVKMLEIPNDLTGEVPKGFKGMTGVAVAPDGSIFCALGYGSNLIHKFDKDGKLLNSFGGRGKKENQLKTPHNLSIDTRFGDPRLLVVDREKRRLIHFDLDGNYIGVYASGLRRPCAVVYKGDHCVVAELEARVTVLDKEGNEVAHLGDNPNKKQWANFKVKAEDQSLGIFSAPHGLSFDHDGNLYVQDWNTTGRVTKLRALQGKH